MHQVEKDTAHDETEARESHHGRALEIFLATLHLQFSALVQDAAVQQFTEMAAAFGGLHQLLERIEPGRKREFHGAQSRLKDLRNVAQLHIGVVQFGRNKVSKELHQQEIDLVAIRSGFLLLAQVVDQDRLQGLLGSQGRSLKKLAQLMNLNAFIRIDQPLPCLLDRFWGWSLHARLQVITRRQVNDELPCERSIGGVQKACGAPFPSRFSFLRCGSHGFTIQLATSRVKRAATAVRPLWYCTATTEASASRELSEFCSRKVSENSRGTEEANRTSRGVPNSMTVFSLKDPLSLPIRVNVTGIRTGVAWGKNFARRPTTLACERALAVPSLAKA